MSPRKDESRNFFARSRVSTRYPLAIDQTMSILNGQRILVLEEQASIGRLLLDMLEAMNCRVIGPATRIPEAFALLVEHDVDAAILDVKIEGQPSLPIAEELLRRGIPWAFASANETDDLAHRYEDVPIITKPFSSDHIGNVLRSLLARNRS
ncbi:hypothetical protein WG901_22030 [Novosphingobium sp. PS1R-30]|uniref:Response regulatory domain-containing protein n=1 Tax=Novosphingobium anseongense TaxID=3133436 RepID=A0ABU8S1X4_9SPHN